MPPPDVEAHEEKEMHEAQVCVFFLFTALMMGTLTKTFLEKYLPSVPYTCVLLFEGAVLGYIHHATNHGLSTLSESIDWWVEINPHVLLFTFLPPLLFGDSMGMNWHHIKKCLWQCLLLACPGVLLGAVLTALTAKWLFPYDWDWSTAMTFGSILAATDPVAVVAILNEVGASQKLTMLISGESLMNDGTAIVLFNLFKDFMVSSGKAQTVAASGTQMAWNIIGVFLRMAVGGVGLGVAMGLLALLWMSVVTHKSSHSDAIVQISITLCCAYLVFFVGEFVFVVSGVLATVAAAIVVGAFGWPLFASRDTMHQVWHIIEHCGNTVIFILSGLIIGAKVTDTQHLRFQDFWYLLIFYVIVNVIRFGMVGLFMPLLMRCGYGLSLRDAIVLSWGGLRGAVGLALALEIELLLAQNEETKKNGMRVLFHVGGIAVLTLMVNGMTSGPLLRYLGMATPSAQEEALLKDIEGRIEIHCEEILNAQIEEREGFTVSQQQEVRARCTVLQKTRRLTPDLDAMSACDAFKSWFKHADSDDRLVAIREMFLQALRCAYSDQVEQGMLPKRGPQTVLLTESVDAALDHVRHGLCTSSIISRKLRLHRPWTKFVNMTCPGVVKNMLVRLGLLMSQRLACFMLLSFVRAHREAQRLVMLNLGKNEKVHTSEEQQVVNEAEQEVAHALSALRKMDQSLVAEVTTQQVCGVVLEQECLFIEKLVDQGVLQEKQAHHLLQCVQHDMQGVSREEWQSTHRGSQQFELRVTSSSSASSASSQRSKWPHSTAQRNCY